MGEIIAFPGSYQPTPPDIETTSKATLIEKAERFLQLRHQQIMLENDTATPWSLAARTNRRVAELLDVQIDRAVQHLQELPPSDVEARHSIRVLFLLADDQPEATDILEEAALYATSAYWDAGYLSTAEVAPLLRERAHAAEERHGYDTARPTTVEAIRAVVTEYVINGTSNDDTTRLRRITEHGLLEYFDHPDYHPDPDPFPPAA